MTPALDSTDRAPQLHTSICTNYIYLDDHEPVALGDRRLKVVDYTDHPQWWICGDLVGRSQAAIEIDSVRC